MNKIFNAELHQWTTDRNDAYKAINLLGKMAGPYIESEHVLQRLNKSAVLAVCLQASRAKAALDC